MSAHNRLYNNAILLSNSFAEHCILLFKLTFGILKWFKHMKSSQVKTSSHVSLTDTVKSSANSRLISWTCWIWGYRDTFVRPMEASRKHMWIERLFLTFQSSLMMKSHLFIRVYWNGTSDSARKRWFDTFVRGIHQISVDNFVIW